MHLIVVGLLLMGSAANANIFGNQNIVMTARCRAQCLNKFIVALTTECQEDFDCLLCWSQCDELYSDANNNVSRQRCDNESVCATGCQESCRFYNSRSELIEATRTDTRFTQPLKYEVDERGDQVHFRWTVPEGNDRIEPLVYVLTVSDGAFEQPLGQTDSNRWSVLRRDIRMFSHLRLTAYDSNGKVAEMEVPLQDIKLEQWTPSLNSLRIRRAPYVLDVDAYISWPRLTDEDVTYQVQWRSSLHKIITTGHLTTQENVAVLSLQPNAWFQVKVTARRTDSPNVIAESETILFFTQIHPKNESWNLQCAGSCVRSRYIVVGVCACIAVAVFIIRMIWKRVNRGPSDSKCTLEDVSAKSEKSSSISKPNFVWHVGSSPEYRMFQNRDDFTWSPPDFKKLPESVRI